MSETTKGIVIGIVALAALLAMCWRPEIAHDAAAVSQTTTKTLGAPARALDGGTP